MAKMDGVPPVFPPGPVRPLGDTDPKQQKKEDKKRQPESGNPEKTGVSDHGSGKTGFIDEYV